MFDAVSEVRLIYVEDFVGPENTVESEMLSSELQYGRASFIQYSNDSRVSS